MVVLDKSIVVRAPPERAFAALRPGVAYGDGAPRPGARFLHLADALGLRWQATTVVDDVAEGRLGFHQLAGDYARLDGRFEVAPAPGGARVRVRLELDLPHVLPRLTTEDEVRRAWSAHVDAMLCALKRRVEA